MQTVFRSTTRLIAAAAVAAIVLSASPVRAGDQEASSSAAAPGEPAKARLVTLDVGGMDSGTQACTDFYQYANGGWLKSNPIPADRPRWATFDELYQRNQNDLRAILEKLAADPTAAEGSEERKLGDFYGARPRSRRRASSRSSPSSRGSMRSSPSPDFAPRSAASSHRGSTRSSRSGRRRIGRIRRR
jgi:peptidase M13-like protein